MKVTLQFSGTPLMFVKTETGTKIHLPWPRSMGNLALCGIMGSRHEGPVEHTTICKKCVTDMRKSWSAMRFKEYSRANT